MMDLPSNTFCVLPWIHLFASEQGENHPCCISLEEQIPNRDQGKIISFGSSANLEQAWNSPMSRAIRRDMLQGKAPASCRRCFSTEALGMESHRQISNQRFHSHISAAIAETKPDGTAPLRLRSLDLRLGNLCNLMCRMCSPVSSRKLSAEWKEISWKANAPADQDWFKNQEFWQSLLSHAQEIEAMHFAGGEPFIIPELPILLQGLIDAGHAKNIELSFNSNLTVLPQRLLALWPKFKGVKVFASVDGLGKVNSFIRHPSSWAELEKNLKILNDQKSELNLLSVNASVTVQAYNILTLTDLLQFLQKELPQFDPPALHILRHPSMFSMQILPLELKELATKKIDDFLESSTSYREALQGIRHFLWESDRRFLLPEFFRRTKIFDANRKQNFFEVFPEWQAHAPHELSEKILSGAHRLWSQARAKSLT